jgi:hypothetical protein
MKIEMDPQTLSLSAAHHFDNLTHSSLPLLSHPNDCNTIITLFLFFSSFNFSSRKSASQTKVNVKYISTLSSLEHVWFFANGKCCKCSGGFFIRGIFGKTHFVLFLLIIQGTAVFLYIYIYIYIYIYKLRVLMLYTTLLSHYTDMTLCRFTIELIYFYSLNNN